MDRRQEYEQLRKEWSSGGIVRTMAERTLGNVCYNCGSTECTELHHVVPLKLGGTNNISNIVVLCSRCHKAAHYGRHIRDYQNKKVTGRPHNVSKEVLNSAITSYINGEIGTKECKAMMGLSPKSKIADMTYYKKFLKDHGIKKVKNNIDILEKKRGDIEYWEVIGFVEYEDGRLTKTIYRQNSNN